MDENIVDETAVPVKQTGILGLSRPEAGRVVGGQEIHELKRPGPRTSISPM
jgi:hypothetical protein